MFASRLHMNHQVFLLLGSNLGDRDQNLAKACYLIEEKIGKVVLKSAVYQTAAWGKTDQPLFLNQALEVSTTHSAEAILSLTQSIENAMSRQRIEKWGARNIDIDIILFDDQIVQTPTLNIPHPEMANRKFVLVPLVEIAADIIHPQLHKKLKEVLQDCTDPLSVEKWPLQA